YLRDFVEYQPGQSAGRVSQLWKTYVQEPWSYVAQKQMKPNSMGKIFHYQPLSEIMALVQDRRSSAGQPGGTHQTTGPSLRGEGVTGMQDFIELFMIRPISALLSSLQMLGKDLPFMVQMDAMISRTTQVLSRPAREQFRIVGRNNINVASEQGIARAARAEMQQQNVLRTARNEI